jgi:hypothetical protein
MNYVQRVLQPGEQVRQISSIHWIVYLPGVAVALLAVIAYWLSDTRLLPGFWRYTSYAFALVVRLRTCCGLSLDPAMVPLVGHRDSSHQPTGHLQDGSHPAGDQRDEHG